jgi:hypothetical protein
VSNPAQLTFDGDVSFGPQDIEKDEKAQPTPESLSLSRDLLRSLSNQNNVQLAVQIVYIPKHMCPGLVVLLTGAV